MDKIDHTILFLGQANHKTGYASERNMPSSQINKSTAATKQGLTSVAKEPVATKPVSTNTVDKPVDDGPPSIVARQQQKPTVPVCSQESATVSETKEQNETKSSSDQPDSQPKTLPAETDGEKQTKKTDDSATKENTAKEQETQQTQETDEKIDEWGPDESEKKSNKYVEFFSFLPDQRSIVVSVTTTNPEPFIPITFISLEANSACRKSTMKFSCLWLLTLLCTNYYLCSCGLYCHILE